MSDVPPPTAADADPDYAGFGLRLRAIVVDGLIQLAFLLPALALFVLAIAKGEERSCSSGRCRIPAEGILVVGFVLFFFGLVVGGWFLVTRLGRTGQTPGRRLAGVRVVDRYTGEPIGTVRALARYALGGTLSAWCCHLGYLWMLWDGRRQTWHDKLAGSIVVRA